MTNKKMASILGMDVSEDDTPTTDMVPVEPHEVVGVDNPDLPSMSDIERKQLQAEKQLEEVINFTLGYQKTIFDDVESVEAKFRSRYIEVANGTLGIALDAIKTKLKTQDERRKTRMKEAEFQKPLANNADGTTNNFFFGSREELIAAIRDDGENGEET